MNKLKTVGIAVVLAGFLAINSFIVFDESSRIPKSVSVKQYERVATATHKQEQAKDAFIVPAEKQTIQVEKDEAVTSWLVQEGEAVTVGQELALLNTDREELRKSQLEAEINSLSRQEDELLQVISGIQSERDSMRAKTSSQSQANSQVKEGKDGSIVGIDVRSQIDVQQEGAFADAIASVEQKISDIRNKMAVLESESQAIEVVPALVSPIDGVVVTLEQKGATPFIEVHSNEKVVITYAKDGEWQTIPEGAMVRLQGEGLEEATEGTVVQVSKASAATSPYLETYKQYDQQQSVNPLAYYEVRIEPTDGLVDLPIASKMNARIVLQEEQAFSLLREWVEPKRDESYQVSVLTKEGKIRPVAVVSPFTLNNRVIITEGLVDGDIVLNTPFTRFEEDMLRQKKEIFEQQQKQAAEEPLPGEGEYGEFEDDLQEEPPVEGASEEPTDSVLPEEKPIEAVEEPLIEIEPAVEGTEWTEDQLAQLEGIEPSYPRVILPMPGYVPTKEEFRSFGWKNYFYYFFTR